MHYKTKTKNFAPGLLIKCIIAVILAVPLFASAQNDPSTIAEAKDVQTQAQFPGGPDAWGKYLSKNLKVRTPVVNGAPAGTYRVFLSFVVDTLGNVSDVRAQNDPGFGTAEEAVRVVEKGPRWKPAVADGHVVTFRQRQVITFLVSNG